MRPRRPVLHSRLRDHAQSGPVPDQVSEFGAHFLHDHEAARVPAVAVTDATVLIGVASVPAVAVTDATVLIGVASVPAVAVTDATVLSGVASVPGVAVTDATVL